MSVLHLITRSPWHSQGLADCLSRLDGGDGILLLADAVYGVTCTTVLANLLEKVTLHRCACHVLDEDLVCRGLADTHLPETIHRVDYPAFVRLTGQHRHCVSWY